VAFEDVKDRAREIATAQWNALQETSLYIQGKEKYDDLATPAQWGVKIAAGIIVTLLTLLLPLTWLSSASDQILTFEENRTLIKDYLKTAKGLQNLPEVIPQLSTSDVKSKVDPVIQSLNLLPEQIKEVRQNTFTAEAGSQLVPSTLTRQGVEVSLSKLNLTQSVDISHKLQSLGEGLKLIGLEIERSPQQTHYYDVKFRVVSFSIGSKPVEPASKEGAKAAPLEKNSEIEHE
jgi:hypothetical protein